MATIFQRKLQNQQGGLLSRIGSFLDRDKTTPGTQLIPGGLSAGVQRVRQSFQQPQQYNVFNQLSRGNVQSNIKPLDIAGRAAGGALQGLSRNFLYDPVQRQLFPSGIIGQSQNLARQPDYQEFSRGERSYRDLSPETRNISQNLVLGTVLDVGEAPGVIDDIAKPITKSIREIIPESPLRNIDEIIPKQSFSGAIEDITKTPQIKKAVSKVDDLLKAPSEAKLGVPKSTFRKTYEAITTPSKRVIRKAGQSGEQVVELLNKSELQGELTSGNQKALLNDAFKALSKDEKKNLADVIEGRISPTSENQAKAVEAWNAISADIYSRAKTAGLDIGHLENYFPRHVITDTSSPKIKSMLSRSSERRYGNLELSRQTDAPYDKDPSVLFEYIDRANQRIADATNFGSDDRVLYNLVNRIADEGGDAQQARKYLDQILGKNLNKTNEDISRVARSIQSFKLGPTSALTNLTQNLSTTLATDPITITKTIGRIIADPDTAVRNAIALGEVDPTQATRVLDELGGTNPLNKWLKLVGFSGAENINRVVAVNAGIEHSNKLLMQAKAGNKAAVRELGRLGFDTKNLNKIDPFLGGKKLSEATQFSTKTGELPYGWQTPIGRILTQFKSFAYKQTGFLADQGKRIASETARGNLKPLINAMGTYGIAAPVAGEIINDIKSVYNNKERTDEGKERYLNNILGAMSLGLFDNYEALTGKYGERGVASTLFGPTVGDVLKGVETYTGAVSGDPYEQTRSVRNLVSSIPGVGRTLANTFVPNSYVDNFDFRGTNLGVNEGLGGQDLQTFKDIQNVNPEAANQFRQQAQLEREQRSASKGGKSIFDIFKKEDTTLTIPSSGASKSDVKEFNGRVDSILEQGVIPEKDVLSERFFKGLDIESKDLSVRSKIIKSLDSVMKDEYYSDEQKKAVLSASGVNPKNYEYYSQASKDVDVKLQELLPKIDRMDNEQMLETLMMGRREIADKQIVTSSMIDYLYEMDYITKDESKMLKALQYDQINDEFYFRKSYTGAGSGGSSGGSGGSGSKKLSYSQAQKLFNIKIPNLSKLTTVDMLLDIYQPESTVKEGEAIIADILAR